MNNRFDHPAWTTAVGTAVAYGIVLVVAFLLLFLVPYAVFATVGG